MPYPQAPAEGLAGGWRLTAGPPWGHRCGGPNLVMVVVNRHRGDKVVPIGGTSLGALGAHERLHASQLFVWRQQLWRRTSTAETIGGPGFVPVLMAEDSAAPAAAACRMEIALGPAVVRVGADVDAAALRRVLEVVRVGAAAVSVPP